MDAGGGQELELETVAIERVVAGEDNADFVPHADQSLGQAGDDIAESPGLGKGNTFRSDHENAPRSVERRVGGNGIDHETD
jgi:hypothetical protein